MTTRRRFLQALGLGASSLLVPPLARSSRGDSSSARPQRLLIFFTLHGTVYDNWKMKPGDGLLKKARWSASLNKLDASDFSPILRPLHPWRERMSIYDGLALVSAETERNHVRHIIGSLHAMTGAHTAIVSADAVGGAPSIDQRIADAISRPDQFRSLELSVGEPLVQIVSRDARQVLPLQTDPALLYQQLFGTGEANLEAAAQAKVFRAAEQWYGSFAAGLSSEDKNRVEIHRGLLHDLELRAQSLASSDCSAPLAPTMSVGYTEQFQDYCQLLTTALACDLTRVATLYMSTQPAERVGPDLEGEVHQEYAHDIYVDPGAAAAMTQYGVRHAEDLAYLLGQLDAIPDGEGSLLDNTTVVWCGELADGAHGYERWPVVVVGGRGLKKGRYEHWPSTTPFAGYRWDGTRTTSMGVPHQKFLIALAQSFGLDLDALPIEEVSGINDAKIDCTGVLDGLLQS